MANATARLPVMSASFKPICHAIPDAAIHAVQTPGIVRLRASITAISQHEATNSAAKAEVALKPHAMQDSADAAPVRVAPEATSKGVEGRENSR